VTYQVKDAWPGGATVWLSVTNTGRTALEAWTLEFDLKSGQHARTGWNGTWRQDGTRVTVTPAPGDAAIAPGMSTGEIGTNIDGPDATGRPGRFALDGTPCRTVAAPLAGPAIAR
jgi:hypothetical protein